MQDSQMGAGVPRCQATSLPPISRLAGKNYTQHFSPVLTLIQCNPEVIIWAMSGLCGQKFYVEFYHTGFGQNPEHHPSVPDMPISLPGHTEHESETLACSPLQEV